MLERVVLISGLSGSGKSTALHALEDIGFYCIDNLPLLLFERFLELIEGKDGVTRVALVADVRERVSLDDAPRVLASLLAKQVPVELLFLDADDDELLRRYSETRRRHPLADRIREGIAIERRLLEPLRELAHRSINTSELSPHELKRLLTSRYQEQRDALAVTIMSFGFKHGIPVEADMVFDVRFLPNPYFDPRLRPLRGTDGAVFDAVFAHQDAQEFLEKVASLMAFVLPRFEREGKRHVTIAIGCTGGHHRSVALAEALCRRVCAEQQHAELFHRDILAGSHKTPS
ncbi:MAG: RNase adapter RapZ [Myxococcota bacterium]|jgi:UPF0042 nucleotide-binding protein|nr:RNase adapter RapZ [Myxococcota bacterium]